MGVITLVQRAPIDPSISDNEALGEIVIGIEQEDSDNEVHHVIRDRNNTLTTTLGRQNFDNRRRSFRTRVPAIPADTTPHRNNIHGSRRNRRYENTLILLRDSGQTEADLDEVSIEDLVPVIQSARTFSRFLCENSMMGLWNSFIECQDEANSGRNGQIKNLKVNGTRALTTPEDAFHGICRKLRNILKQRHLPLGIVDNLEAQVLEFFQTHPLNSTYECGPLDAYRRGLLHAISQYNNLKSYSVGKKKTEKIVHVQNKQTEFLPPSLRLVSYIETRLQNDDN